MAANAFLNSGEVIYKKEENTVYISKIFYWYKGDFGGKKGTIQFLKKYNVLPEDANPKIQYNEYNWNIMEKKFLEEKELE